MSCSESSFLSSSASSSLSQALPRPDSGFSAAAAAGRASSCARTWQSSRRIAQQQKARRPRADSQTARRPAAKPHPTHPPPRSLRKPLRRTSPAHPMHPAHPLHPLHPARGPISAGRIAMGATPRRRFARAGRAKDFAACGSSRSAAVTRRLSSPMAARSRSSSGANRKWSPPTMCRPDASSGRTRGMRASKNRWAETARARRRPITTGASTRLAPKENCACSTRRRARWCGGATSFPITARTT